MVITQRLPRESGRDFALRMIKENIIRLELVPGSMVSENELSAELNLSRTPVREALIELSKVSIVEILPQKGSVVARVDLTLVEQAQFMRNLLECAVVEICCENITEDNLRVLYENVKLQEFYLDSYDADVALLQLDDEFHEKLFEIAKKTQVFTLMRNIAIHFDRVRNLTLKEVTYQSVISDHRAIVDAIKAKDAKVAKELMERHLARYRLGKKAIMEQFPDYFTSE